MMTPKLLAEKLAATKPLQLSVIPTLIKLQEGGVTSAQLIELADEVEQGRKEMEEHYYKITKVRAKCLELKPKPSSAAPMGF